MTGEIRKPKSTVHWTNKEVAQLLVAVYNLGEGDWVEVQKRMDFSSSSVVKDPTQLSERYHMVKRIMRRDLRRLRKNSGKVVQKHDWIVAALRSLNASDPAGIGLHEV